MLTGANRRNNDSPGSLNSLIYYSYLSLQTISVPVPVQCVDLGGNRLTFPLMENESAAKVSAFDPSMA